ncbi:hypothetical protein [Spirosoma sp.]|uniref:hypothetical protein n=1 Tax=Spirosoma sp. TaxID=1899569 RepID=UPI003B3B5345
MKTVKYGLASIILACWLMSCSSGSKPNSTVEAAFTNKFGKVEQVAWSSNVDYSYAHFTQHGKPVVAVFGNDGQFIATDPAKPIN